MLNKCEKHDGVFVYEARRAGYTRDCPVCIREDELVTAAAKANEEAKEMHALATESIETIGELRRALEDFRTAIRAAQPAEREVK
jgi:hypothetical protein